MTHSIFRYTDQDDDTVGVDARTPSDGREAWLTLRIFEDSLNVLDARAVDIPRDHVLELHAALGEWLYPTHTPEWANKSLIEQMIEKAVKDQVAAVLPLHLKPVATVRCDGTACCSPHPVDPEPHDVGHSEPYFPPLHLATESECRADSQNPCTAARHLSEGEADHGRLMSELPVRTRPRPICVSCGHGWGQHYSGICWGEPGTAMQSEPGCTCTRQRPGTTPVPCTCDMQHSHRPVIRNGSPATCAYRDCECEYRSMP